MTWMEPERGKEAVVEHLFQLDAHRFDREGELCWILKVKNWWHDVLCYVGNHELHYGLGHQVQHLVARRLVHQYQ